LTHGKKRQGFVDEFGDRLIEPKEASDGCEG
jgi:hypothetical protein